MHLRLSSIPSRVSPDPITAHLKISKGRTALLSVSWSNTPFLPRGCLGAPHTKLARAVSSNEQGNDDLLLLGTDAGKCRIEKHEEMDEFLPSLGYLSPPSVSVCRRRQGWDLICSGHGPFRPDHAKACRPVRKLRSRSHHYLRPGFHFPSVPAFIYRPVLRAVPATARTLLSRV